MINKIVYLSLILSATGFMQAMNEQTNAGTQTETAQVEVKKKFNAEATNELFNLLMCDNDLTPAQQIARLEELIKAGADFHTLLQNWRRDGFLWFCAPDNPDLLEILLNAGADPLNINKGKNDSKSMRISLQDELSRLNQMGPTAPARMRIPGIEKLIAMLEAAEKLHLTKDF
jgi:hypothetical protein